MNDLEIDLATQLAEALAEVERLREAANAEMKASLGHQAEVERLTAILREGAEGNGLFKSACQEVLAEEEA